MLNHKTICYPSMQSEEEPVVNIVMVGNPPMHVKLRSARKVEISALFSSPYGMKAGSHSLHGVTHNSIIRVLRMRPELE
jgi:hypothetical protein